MGPWVLVACPVCGGSIERDEVPNRLPVAVPDHAHGGVSCPGSGHKSSNAWMVKAGALRVATR